MAEKPWVEKYRPKDLGDVAYQRSAVTMLESALAAQSLPHMLFYGPPGTGKTSVALVVANRLFGTEYRSRVLELNASDDRGIDVVRHRIKERASRRVGEKGDAPDFQLIILDEADCMTTDAQKALLRTMEVYSNHTRFIIICNYVSRMISPLVSRCARIRFQSLPEHAMKERLCAICEWEDVDLDESAFQTLTKAAKGDLRRAVMLLQSAVKFAGPSVSMQTLLEISGHVPDSIIQTFESESARGPSASYAAVMDATRNGYSAQQILQQFSEHLLHSANYDEVKKAEIFEVIADADHKLSSGSNEALQLMLVGSAIANATDFMMTD